MSTREAKIATIWDIKQPINELAKLEEAAKKAKAEVAAIGKSIKEASTDAEKSKMEPAFKKAKEEAVKLDSDVKKLQKSTDITNMSYNQLNNYVNRLTKELKGTVEGTENYNRALKQLEPAQKLLNDKTKAFTELKKITTENTSSMARFRDVLLGTFGGNILFNGLQMAIQGVKNFFSGSVGSFMDFEVAMKAVKAEVQPTAEQLESLKKQAMELGPQFGKTAKDMMDAYNVVGSGMSELIDTEGALEKVTDAAIKLSIAGEMDLTPAAETVTEALSQFGGGANDAAKFIDIMATGSQVGAAKISDISASLKYVGPVSQAAGVSFLETNAALQVLSATGIKGEQAGTALRGTLLNLVKSGDESINPAVVGMAKAMENLAAKNYDVAEMAKLVGTQNVSAALSMVANVPKLKEWTAEIDKGGGAEEMFADKTATLKFQLDQAKASITNKAVALGEFLAPALSKVIASGIAFIDILISLPKWLAENKTTILGVVTALVAFDLALAQSNIRLLASSAAAKAKSIWDAAVTTTTNLWTLAQNGLNAAMKANLIGLVISLLIALGTATYAAYQKSETFRAAINALFAYIKEGVKIFVDFGQALLSLDFKKAAETITTSFARMSASAADAYAKTRAEAQKTTDALAIENKKQSDGIKQKTAEEEAKIAEIQAAEEKAEENSKERAKEAKKRAEEIKKANEDAIKKIGELQADYHLAEIRRKDGEYAAEVEKLNLELAAAKRAVEESKALKANKDKQIELLEKTHQQKLQDLAEKAREKETELVNKWLAESDSTKLRKLQEQYEKDLAEARRHIRDKEQLALVEKQITANLAAERQKILDTERESELKKYTEALNKRLKDEKQVLETEKTAYENILKFKELAARGNAAKLVQVAKDRAANELKFSLQLLELEYKAEKEKATKEIQDQTRKNEKLRQLDKKFAEDTEKLQLDHQKKITKIQDDAINARIKKKQAAVAGFSALLKFDFSSAMDHFSKLAEGQSGAIIKISKETAANIQMAADAAKTAVNFLNDLVQEKAKARLKALEKNYNAELKVLQKALDKQEKAVEKSGNDVEKLLKKHSQDVQKINQDEKQKVADLNTLYSEIKKAGAEFDFQDAVTKSRAEADQKVADANLTSQEQIRAANDTKNEQIIAADAAYQAFVNYTLSRLDISEAEKQELIAKAAQQREAKITEATTTYNTSVELSNAEKEQKILDAQAEHDRKLELMDAMKEADHERAEELLQLAQDEKEKKLDLAEEEKNEKLKKLELENQTRLLEKDNLDKALAEKEKAYRKEKYRIELDAFKKQQKADIAVAIINGALAAIKALASGMYPLNLVFAAATAVLTGIQVAKIKSQPGPEPPTFAGGTEYVRRGIGGVPPGTPHGPAYGAGGIALIDRITGRELGEMEGHEAIIPVSQTRANMPVIRRMLEKARRGDSSPLLPADLPRFRFGGFLLPQAPRLQFTYGSDTVADDFSQSSAEAGLSNSGTSDPSYQEAKAQGEKQLKLLEGIIKSVEALQKESVGILKFIQQNTAANVSATKAVSDNIGKMDARGALSAIMDRLRTLK